MIKRVVSIFCAIGFVDVATTVSAAAEPIVVIRPSAGASADTPNSTARRPANASRPPPGRTPVRSSAVAAGVTAAHGPAETPGLGCGAAPGARPASARSAGSTRLLARS